MKGRIVLALAIGVIVGGLIAAVTHVGAHTHTVTAEAPVQTVTTAPHVQTVTTVTRPPCPKLTFGADGNAAR